MIEQKNKENKEIKKIRILGKSYLKSLNHIETYLVACPECDSLFNLSKNIENGRIITCLACKNKIKFMEDK